MYSPMTILDMEGHQVRDSLFFIDMCSVVNVALVTVSNFSILGSPCELNVYADAEAAFEYLTEEIGLSPHQIVLYGRSLGSGPSCYLAQKSARECKSVGGLILHSPFASVYRVVVNLGFTVSGDKFPNIDRINEVE